MAERMQVEADDDAVLLEALRQEGVVGPQTQEAAREASKVYELLLVTGVSRGMPRRRSQSSSVRLG